MKNLDKYKEKYKDDRFYKEIFIDEIYGPLYNKKKDIVLDVGAVAGEFSFWIDGGTVYAIEPQHEYYKELEDNINEIGTTNIKPFKLALAGENGAKNLTIGARGGGQLGGDRGQQTITKTLATFMKENNIDHINILKIDAEQGENEIFNAPDFKDVADKIDCIMGEHLEQLGGLLEGYGFKSTHTAGSNILFEK